MSFLDVEIIREPGNIQPSFTANQPLAVIILVLTVIYHLPTKLAV